MCVTDPGTLLMRLRSYALRDRLPPEAQRTRTCALGRLGHAVAAVNPAEYEELAALRAQRTSAQYRNAKMKTRIASWDMFDGKLDALLRKTGVDYGPLSTVPVDVRSAVEQGEYIAAIKRLREATGLGLKDAKEQVDELRRRTGLTIGILS